jgi:hypothetical protein
LGVHRVTSGPAPVEVDPDDSAEISRLFVSAILDHNDGILVLPFAGRARDDVRRGMRTSTFEKRTLVAYEVDESR